MISITNLPLRRCRPGAAGATQRIHAQRFQVRLTPRFRLLHLEGSCHCCTFGLPYMSPNIEKAKSLRVLNQGQIGMFQSPYPKFVGCWIGQMGTGVVKVKKSADRPRGQWLHAVDERRNAECTRLGAPKCQRQGFIDWVPRHLAVLGPSDSSKSFSFPQHTYRPAGSFALPKSLPSAKLPGLTEIS
jgi:hypothetical protein